MRELSKIEMIEVSGAGYLGDLAKDITTAAGVAISSISNVFVEASKVFADSVHNTFKNFWASLGKK